MLKIKAIYIYITVLLLAKTTKNWSENVEYLVKSIS